MGDFAIDFRDLTVRRTIVEVSLASSGTGSRFVWKDYPKGKKPRILGLRTSTSNRLRVMVAERGLSREDRLFSMPDHGCLETPRRTGGVGGPDVIQRLLGAPRTAAGINGVGAGRSLRDLGHRPDVSPVRVLGVCKCAEARSA